MMTNEEYRIRLRTNLAKYLNGKENIDKRRAVMEQLNKTDNAIKSWCAPNSSAIPAANDLPVICEILGITLNQLFGIEDKRIEKALMLYNSYEEHPLEQSSVNKLLDFVKDK